MKSTNIIQPKQLNGEKTSIHSSLSTLPMSGMKKTNQVESNTLQIRPPKDLQQQKKANHTVDPGYRKQFEFLVFVFILLFFRTMIDVLPGLLEVPVESKILLRRKEMC
jgi:hypothetical protein